VEALKRERAKETKRRRKALTLSEYIVMISVVGKLAE